MPQNTSHFLDEKWPLQLDLIRKLINEQIPTGRGGKFSAMAAEEFLGVTPKKWKAWESGQRPSADDLERIGRKLHLAPKWLLFGEGEPFTATEDSACEASFTSPVQSRLIKISSFTGAATGWYSPVTQRFEYSFPAITSNWIALQVNNNLLAEKGLPQGCILFCNPHQLPRMNEPVYIRRKNGTEAVRLWLGYKTSACALLSRYQSDAAKKATPTSEELPLEDIQTLAPVIFVQLRV